MRDATGRLTVLISGRGSNLRAFLQAQQSGELDGEINAVISNRPQAPGLEIAREAGIATEVLDHTLFETREAFDEQLAQIVHNYSPDVVVLAGFMRILTPAFVAAFRGRLINIHPSLLPKYRGLNTHQRAIDAGEREAGATVHFVTADLDCGPGILQARVPVVAGDSAESLAARVLPVEHQLYPRAANLVLTGRAVLGHDSARLDDRVLLPGGEQWQPA